MKKLIPPSLDAKSIYQTIKNRSRGVKKKTILGGIEDYVLQRYSIYDDLKYRLEEMNGSQITDIDEKEALLSCYTRNSKGYLEGEVVAKIIKAQTIQHRQSCPYCGLDKSRTIDHYLPKSEFPEFSIYPSNLIPCCGHCNLKKSDNWLEAGKRKYINLYFDDIPSNVRFLFTTIRYEGNNSTPLISFSVRNDHEINEELFDLIESHYTGLGLLDEFSLSVEESISGIVDEIVHNPQVTIKEHKESLKRRYETNVRKYGLNHWKSSFLFTLIDSEEFFNNTLSRIEEKTIQYR